MRKLVYNLHYIINIKYLSYLILYKVCYRSIITDTKYWLINKNKVIKSNGTHT